MRGVRSLNGPIEDRVIYSIYSLPMSLLDFASPPLRPQDVRRLPNGHMSIVPPVHRSLSRAMSSVRQATGNDLAGVRHLSQTAPPKPVRFARPATQAARTPLASHPDAPCKFRALVAVRRAFAGFFRALFGASTSNKKGGGLADSVKRSNVTLLSYVYTSDFHDGAIARYHASGGAGGPVPGLKGGAPQQAAAHSRDARSPAVSVASAPVLSIPVVRTVNLPFDRTTRSDGLAHVSRLTASTPVGSRTGSPESFGNTSVSTVSSTRSEHQKMRAYRQTQTPLEWALADAAYEATLRQRGLSELAVPTLAAPEPGAPTPGAPATVPGPGARRASRLQADLTRRLDAMIERSHAREVMLDALAAEHGDDRPILERGQGINTRRASYRG